MTLLNGGQDVGPQGWTVVQEGPATLDFVANTTRLTTSTDPDASSGGRLLLTHPVPPGVTDFELVVVLAVDAVGPHNPLDAAVAVMGAFTGPAGTQAERGQMVYVEPTEIGWADDSQRADEIVGDGQFHHVNLSVRGTTATVDVGGADLLTRTGFVKNGTIAIGDETTDAGADATIRIASVGLVCL